MADSDRDWRCWGETEPYYGVLADPRFRRDALAGNRAAFFEMGRLAVEERLAVAERQFGTLGRQRALDFGCGVGRLSLPLAAHFDEVVGLDIAPAMLDEARRNAEAQGLSNLTFAPSDDALSAAAGAFDMVMTMLVLQHIPVRRGMGIVERLLAKVAPGGVAALQLCTRRPDDRATRLRGWAQQNIPGLHGLFNRSRGRPWGEPFMQMNAYPLGEVIALARRSGFSEPLVEPYFDGRFEIVQLLMQRRA